MPLFDKVLISIIFEHYAGLVLNENAHTCFSGWELYVIRNLVEPFERVFQKRLGPAQSAHRMMVEQPVDAAKFKPRAL